MARFASAAMLVVLLSFNVAFVVAGSGCDARCAANKRLVAANHAAAQATKNFAKAQKSARDAAGGIGFPKGVRGEQSRQLALVVPLYPNRWLHS